MYGHHGKQVSLHPDPVTLNTTLNFVTYYLGQQCVDMLREELGPSHADIHVPVVKGGVQLHKLQWSKEAYNFMQWESVKST